MTDKSYEVNFPLQSISNDFRNFIELKEKGELPQCNGPFGDEEDCPIHGAEIRKGRGKL